MKKHKFKIGDIAEKLNIKKSQIRQWEQDFNLATQHSSTYDSDDLSLFSTIKAMIREQHLSVDEIKKELLLQCTPQTTPARKYVDEHVLDTMPVVEITPPTTQKINLPIKKQKRLIPKRLVP